MAACLTAMVLTLATGIVGNAFTVLEVRADRTPAWAQHEPDAVADIVMRGPLWGNEQFPLIWVQPNDAAVPPPPGLRAWPAPGEVVVSPGLAARPEIIEGLGLRVSDAGTGTDGAIGDEGVITRSELMAYAAPPPGRDLGPDGARYSISGFGLPLGDDRALLIETDPDFPEPVPAMIGVLLFLVVPATAVLLAALHMRSNVRQRRARTLLLLGFRRKQVRRHLLQETLTITAPAALGGTVLMAGILTRVTSVPGTGWTLAPGVLSPAPGLLAIAFAAVVAAASLATLGTRVPTDATPTRVSMEAPPRVAGIYSVAAGVALVALLVIIGLTAPVWGRYVMWPILLAACVIWPGLTAAAVRGIGAVRARRAHRVEDELSGRQLSHQSGTLAALVGPVGQIVVLVAVVLASTAQAVDSGLAAPVHAGSQVIAVSWRDPRPGDVDTFTRALTTASTSTPGAPDPDTLPAIPWIAETPVARTCSDVARFLDRSPTDCDGEQNLPDGLSEEWERVVGTKIRVDPQAVWEAVPPAADVLVRGASTAEVYAVAQSMFTAPDVSWVNLSLDMAQALARWLTAGVMAAMTLLALAVLVRFTDLAASAGTGRARLERTGITATHARTVRESVTRTALLTSTTLAATFAMLFIWAGQQADVTTIRTLTWLAVYTLVTGVSLTILTVITRHGRT
ncbi:ABC transporter permease [Xylanimonas cellulosilytica]|uniref:ABC transporter permease n=1 Tax=Xylanimonas cellulosilytica TaxID=186189 RepID=UPI00165157D5|nr:FtsX-like permease family protein [Xylanimonas cellulosilytica]